MLEDGQDGTQEEPSSSQLTTSAMSSRVEEDVPAPLTSRSVASSSTSNVSSASQIMIDQFHEKTAALVASINRSIHSSQEHPVPRSTKSRGTPLTRAHRSTTRNPTSGAVDPTALTEFERIEKQKQSWLVEGRTRAPMKSVNGQSLSMFPFSLPS